MKRLFLFFAVISCIPVLAQKPSGDTTFPPGLIIKTTPFSPIRLPNSGLEFSAEYGYTPRFSTQLTAGIMLRGPEGYTNVRGFSLALEQRYYFKTRPAFDHPYLALEIPYLRRQYDANIEFGDRDWYDDSTGIKPYVDSVTVKKQLIGFALRAGMQSTWGRFTFDFAIGLGVRWRQVSHEGRLHPEDPMTPPIDINAFYISNNTGPKALPYFPVNFRIGYRFYP